MFARSAPRFVAAGRGLANSAGADSGGVFAGSKKLVAYCSGVLGVCFAQQFLIPDSFEDSSAQYSTAAADAARRGITAVERARVAQMQKHVGNSVASQALLGPEDEGAEPRYGGAFKQVAIPEPNTTEIRYGGAFAPVEPGK
jgi:hypothetical protein